MAKCLTESRLTTRSARAVLRPGLHWRAIDPEIHLGYRKGARGGRWLVRWYAGEQKYRQAALGVADDAVATGTLSYEAAFKAAKEVVETSRKLTEACGSGPTPTVRSALKEYIAERDRREIAREGREVRSDAYRRLNRHALSDEKFAETPLHRLTEDDIAGWVSRIDQRLKRVTRLRLVNDVKAALNRTHRRLRKVLPPDFGETIRFGLMLECSSETAEPVARENQILTDDQVRAIVSSATQLDNDGDFAQLVILLAATGARFSQVVRLHIRDIQPERLRIMMPTSRKGRNRIDSFTPIPVGFDVLEALAPAMNGRRADDRLLVRWRHAQISMTEWIRVDRGPWKTPSEMIRPWHKACEAAGLKGTVPYALRHSSIVRGIRLGLPIRLVAALHDTSVAMIERHYGRWIADGLDEIAARAVVPLLTAPPASGDASETSPAQAVAA